MAKLKLSPPWDTYYSEVNEMFKKDPSVHVIMDDETYTLKLYVNDSTKADALQTLLPETKEYGGVTLKIEVIPANTSCGSGVRVVYDDSSEDYLESLLNAAFHGNPVLIAIRTVHGGFGFSACYAVFKKEVVQYFDDNMSDINGLHSTLYEEIAKDIFKNIPGVFYCTSANKDQSLSYAFSF